MEATTYRTIEFLISLLPSLGFVGTVIGMGDALLAADGLFSSRDKQQTITHITQQLGYAFDTTLIALIAALLAGVLVVICRIQENRVYTDIANQFFNPKPKR
jgi:biopolymer transport protein ExbB/TolQ